MGTIQFRPLVYSVLAALGTLQLSVVRSLKHVVPLVLVSNCYVDQERGGVNKREKAELGAKGGEDKEREEVSVRERGKRGGMVQVVDG